MEFFLLRVWGHGEELLAALRRGDYLYLVPAVGFLGLLYYLRVRRWQLFVRPIKETPARSVAVATCIGFMANCVLPLRLGEVVRPYVLHRREKIRFAVCVATSAGLERSFDMAGLGMLIIAAALLLRGRLPTSAESAESVRAGLVLFAALAFVVVAAVAWLALAPNLFLRVGRVFTPVLPAKVRRCADEFLEHLADGMQFVRSGRGVAVAMVYSLAQWVAQGLSTYCVGRCLGIDLGVAGAFVVAIAVALAVAAPQAPAYLGPFQGAAMLATEMFSVGRGEAAALAILMWLVNVAPITLVGLALLWHDGLSLRKLAAASGSIRVDETVDSP